MHVPVLLEASDVAERWVSGQAESFGSSVVEPKWVDSFAPCVAYVVAGGDASFAGAADVASAIAFFRRLAK